MKHAKIQSWNGVSYLDAVIDSDGDVQIDDDDNFVAFSPVGAAQLRDFLLQHFPVDSHTPDSSEPDAAASSEMTPPSSVPARDGDCSLSSPPPDGEPPAHRRVSHDASATAGGHKLPAHGSAGLNDSSEPVVSGVPSARYAASTVSGDELDSRCGV